MRPAQGLRKEGVKMPLRRVIVTLIAVLTATAALHAPASAAETRTRYDRDPEVIRQVVEDSRKRWSPEAEQKIGKPVVEEYEKAVPRLDWPDQQARVQAIVDRIAAVSDRPEVHYEVGILDDASPNAMAIPGGYIRVTRGLLDMVQSDDELAGVLAHEIAHNCLYHGMRQVQEDSKWSKLQILSVLATVAAAAAGALDAKSADLQNLPWMIMMARAGWLQGYSRRYEYEADWSGMRYQMAAGYDPSGFYTFMRRMMNWEDRNGWRRVPEDFTAWDSHPPTQDRLLYVGEFFSEHDVSLNIARVCRGFVAVARQTEVGEGNTVWEVCFGDRVIFQPAQTDVAGQSAEQRATTIAERINRLVAQRGARHSYVEGHSTAQNPWVGLCGAPVISIAPEDARLVGLTPAAYTDQVTDAFREAIYHAEQVSMEP
jgi:Zn-dependent protease with chaperone function